MRGRPDHSHMPAALAASLSAVMGNSNRTARQGCGTIASSSCSTVFEQAPRAQRLCRLAKHTHLIKAVHVSEAEKCCVQPKVGGKGVQDVRVALQWDPALDSHPVCWCL